MKFYKDFDLKEFVAEGRGYDMADYVKGLPDGKYFYKCEFWSNVYRVSVKNGKRNGVEEKYSREGTIERTTDYKDGRKQGLEICYNSKGEKTEEKYYENGFMLYEIHYQRKKEKTLEQIKQLERVLKELKESVEKTQCKGLGFID